jgi:hypothetical protein
MAAIDNGIDSIQVCRCRSRRATGGDLLLERPGSRQQPGAEPAMQTDTIKVQVLRMEALWGEPD